MAAERAHGGHDNTQTGLAPGLRPSASRSRLPPAVVRAAQLLAKLPGVGEKTALRFALHLVTNDPRLASDLSEMLRTLGEQVRPCGRCGNIAEVTDATTPPRCSVCLDDRRDPSLLCVVARVSDLLAIERSGVMRGRYFVLGRLLSPLEGVGAADLPIDVLRARVRDPEAPVLEILVATPPTVDGEATALLLARELGALGATVTRIASGVPHGGDLEYFDQVTIGRAIEGRKVFG